jgi:hypothetical protein
MHSADRLLENGTFIEFYPEVIDQYMEYTNNVYEPDLNVEPGMFDDVPQPIKDIIFAAIDAPPGFSTQDAVEYIGDPFGFVFRYMDFADIEAFI